MASVDVRGVHKAYGSTKVIHGVDVPIADGEFVILVGHPVAESRRCFG